METASDGDRYREVVQPDQRLWVHSAARRRQGRFRPYFGGREGWSVDPQRGSAGPVRRGCKQGEDLGGEPQGEVNRMWGASRAPPWGSIVSSPEQKPEDFDTILRGVGGFQGLAVQQAKADPNAFEPAAANENVPGDRTRSGER